MSDAAPAPDAWAELRAIADALDDELIVLPEGLEADEPAARGASVPGAELDPWDELRAIAEEIVPDRSVLPQQR